MYRFNSYITLNMLKMPPLQQYNFYLKMYRYDSYVDEIIPHRRSDAAGEKNLKRATGWLNSFLLF